jgi:hypothetical protein
MLIVTSSGSKAPNAAVAFKEGGQIAAVSTAALYVIMRFILSFIPLASDTKATVQTDAARVLRKKWITTAAVSGPIALIAGYIMVASVQANAIPGASIGGFIAFCAVLLCCYAFYRAFGRKSDS